jgi:hypothetical protein
MEKYLMSILIRITQLIQLQFILKSQTIIFWNHLKTLVVLFARQILFIFIEIYGNQQNWRLNLEIITKTFWTKIHFWTFVNRYVSHDLKTGLMKKNQFLFTQRWFFVAVIEWKIPFILSNLSDIKQRGNSYFWVFFCIWWNYYLNDMYLVL